MPMAGMHLWARMGVWGHNCGFGHRKEAKRAAGGCCQSRVHARTAERRPKIKVCRRGERDVSRVTGAHRGDVIRTKALQKNTQPETQAKKQTERQRENRQQPHTHTQQNTTTQHIIQPLKTAKTSKNNADKTHNTKKI